MPVQCIYINVVVFIVGGGVHITVSNLIWLIPAVVLNLLLPWYLNDFNI